MTSRSRKPVSLLFVRLILCSLLLVILPSGPVSASSDPQIARAISSMEQHDFSTALTLLKGLEERLLDPSQVSPLIGKAYLGLGDQALRRRDYREAVEAFLEGQDYTPDDVSLYLGEATAHYLAGQYAAAEIPLLHALGMDGHRAGTYLLLGKVYYADGRMEQSLDILDAAIQSGGDEQVIAFREKVRREWQLEQTMSRDRGGVFQVSIADDGRSDLAGAILDVLEDAYAELGSDLSFFPDVQVPVLLYTRQEFSRVTDSPEWAGGLYDGKIRIPLGGLDRMTPNLERLLYHEYSHVLVRFIARGRAPVWVNEGVAELAGERGASTPSHLREDLYGGTLHGWSTLENSFRTLSPEEVPRAYAQSHAMIAFLVDRYGWHTLRDALVLVGEGYRWPDAVDRAYEVYGLTWQGIDAEWRSGLMGH